MAAKEKFYVVCDNKQAMHAYFIEDRYEAGIVLQGREVKALREGRANLRDGYAVFRGLELYLINTHIAPYSHSAELSHDPLRTRKLLMKRSELHKLWGRMQIRGYSLIPLKIYFKDGFAKVEVALAKGKKLHDKRQATKEREADRYMAKITKKHRHQ